MSLWIQIDDFAVITAVRGVRPGFLWTVFRDMSGRCTVPTDRSVCRALILIVAETLTHITPSDVKSTYYFVYNSPNVNFVVECSYETSDIWTYSEDHLMVNFSLSRLSREEHRQFRTLFYQCTNALILL